MYWEDAEGRAVIRVESEVDAVLKALAHPYRRAVVEMLAERDTDATELTVVAAVRFGLASSTASEHLRNLRDAGLVRAWSRAPCRVYSLGPAARSLARWAGAIASSAPGDWVPYEVEG